MSADPATPQTRPSPLPSSNSNRSLSSVASPASPKPASHTKNYHPYLIQSTSSSLLTRSNSSPAQPLHALGRHRPSRSMSSLAAAAESPLVGKAKVEEENRRKSLESPNRPMMRRSGTLPSFLEEKKGESSREVILPNNPKTWTPADLANFLGYTLRTGGSDGTGQVLPAPLVEDIKSWVLRQRVTGRAFLRGNAETWSSASRPPPFLDLLLTISRRLRRSSLQAQPRLSDPLDGADSVLFEGDEADEDDAEDGISGVKRMANAYEARDSASEASDDEGPRPLRPQLTGGSESAWEKWGLKRQNTGGSDGFYRLRRSSRSESLREGSPPEERIITPLLDGVTEDEEAIGTVKAPPTTIEAFDIPPELREDEDEDEALGIEAKAQLKVEEPRARSEVTPTLERTTAVHGLGFTPPAAAAADIVPEIGSPEAGKIESQAGPERYGSLRRGKRVPTLRRRPSENVSYDSADEQVGSRRRTTLRPSAAHVNSIFDSESLAPSAREQELEAELAEARERVKSLESRLEAASRPTTPVTRRMGQGVADGILEKLGMVKRNDDGLPRTVGELPAYLFLVGFGVGAVMMRVIFGRSR